MTDDKPQAPAEERKNETAKKEDAPAERPTEVGGRGGLDPTRYGDWEKNGKCVDF